MDTLIKTGTGDGQTVYPRFHFAKLIRQAHQAEKAQSAVAASRVAMECSEDVLDMAFFQKDFVPLVV